MDWGTIVPFTEKEEYTVKPEMELSPMQLKKFYKSITCMVQLFAFDLKDLSTCNVGCHKLRTTVKDCQPIHTHPYPKSVTERNTMKKEIELMLELGIIEHSKSPWSSPVIIVMKKDKTRRFVVDYRNVNAILITETWPLPRIQDILDRLAGSIYFSVLDLTQGYWQIKMHEDSKAMTAFQTPDGNYQFKRMPFGLKNAVSEFSKIMFTVLGHLSNFVEIYLDDITIHSKNYEDHLNHIETVAACLKEANLKIKPSKCKWICAEISLLGHIVSGGTVRMDPKKIDAIQLRTPPKNMKHVQQYLGICNYKEDLFKIMQKWLNQCLTY